MSRKPVGVPGNNTMPAWKVTVVLMAAVALVIVVLGAIRWSRGSVTSESWATCRICRAQRHEKRAIARVVSSQVTDTPFSRYYQTSVDPSHKHDWHVTAVQSQNAAQYVRGGRLCADGPRTPGTELQDEMLLKILQALPDAASRKALVAKAATDFNAPDYPKVRRALLNVRNAYRAAPGRKDWTAVLGKYGLYGGK